MATDAFPTPSTTDVVNMRFSSLIIAYNKSATAAPIPSQVAPRPWIISYAALRTLCSMVLRVVFGKDILDETFPECDESKLEKDDIQIPMQINGKMKGTIDIKKTMTQQEVEELVYNSGKVDKSTVKKVIYVPNKIINFIVMA